MTGGLSSEWKDEKNNGNRSLLSARSSQNTLVKLSNGECTSGTMHLVMEAKDKVSPLFDIELYHLINNSCDCGHTLIVVHNYLLTNVNYLFIVQNILKGTLCNKNTTKLP
jgi:hypothetical protein